MSVTDKGVVFGAHEQKRCLPLCDTYGLDCDDEATPDEANVAQHLWKGGHFPKSRSLAGRVAATGDGQWPQRPEQSRRGESEGV